MQTKLLDPGVAGSRAGYAAERARVGGAELVAWPPARNSSCWCRSGLKYKKCCGHRIVAASTGENNVVPR